MKPIKILLLGSGGREHALAWKISQSPMCEKLYIAPGNAGTRECGENVNVQVNDFLGIQSVCLREHIELVIATGLGMNIIGSEAAKFLGLEIRTMEEILSKEDCVVAPAVGTALLMEKFQKS